MKIYKIKITAAFGIPERTIEVYVDDSGHVSRCEPSNSFFLGMREDTFRRHANVFKYEISEAIDPSSMSRVFLITYFDASGRDHAEIFARDEDSAIEQFIRLYGKKPLRIYERIGVIEEANVLTYKVKRS